MRIRWREFELPNRVVQDESVGSESYGMFIAEPFEKGFGHTIGNGLRRVLLSALEGSAPTHLKIAGVDHEFATIEGVVEDVTQIVLNVKKLLVRMTTSEPRVLRLRWKGQGQVTAAAIEESSDAEIVNTTQHICSVSGKDTELDFEITVRRGRGYVTADENFDEDMELGVIPLDSIFSPVQRVRYAVHATRVGKMTNYDKLVMETWTDGTVTPDMAMLEAAKIYRKHLNPFVMPADGGGSTPAGIFAGLSDEDEGGGGDASIKELLLRPIDTLDLSVRAANCMAEQEIETIGELVRRSKDELLQVKNFGKTSLREIEKKLKELSLDLGMDVDAVLNA